MESGLEDSEPEYNYNYDSHAGPETDISDSEDEKELVS